MASRADALDAAISNVIARIQEVTASPKPNYSLDGEDYSWGDYLQVLTDNLLALEQARQRAEAPFEVRSYGA